MGVAMAGMFSPWGDPVPARAGIVAFSVLGAWFAALVLRGELEEDPGDDLPTSEPIRDLPGAWNEVPEGSWGLVRRGTHETQPFQPITDV